MADTLAVAYEIGESGGMDEEQETKPTPTQQQQQQGVRPPNAAASLPGALVGGEPQLAPSFTSTDTDASGRQVDRTVERVQLTEDEVPEELRPALLAFQQKQRQQKAGVGGVAAGPRPDTAALGKPSMIRIDDKSLASMMQGRGAAPLQTQVSLFRDAERGRPGLVPPSLNRKNRPPRRPSLKGMGHDSDEESIGHDSQEDEPQISAEAQELQTLEMRSVISCLY